MLFLIKKEEENCLRIWQVKAKPFPEVHMMHMCVRVSVCVCVSACMCWYLNSVQVRTHTTLELGKSQITLS